ncbi:hypothetical protein BGZ65_006903 [Modicella reniformis]|uniref:F-box domain-containing protein n=1 Tax=Modicella reniformis TaxID=1440133 RepID=A0A9P6J569_9FUNG|nr:hypothetical protein BGZ65_006903 [Modicella reniformis]
MADQDPTPTTMSQLPQECIERIISYFERDIYSLFHLLTVNSIFFKATLPVLYRDPYRSLEKQIRENALIHNRYCPSFSTSLPAKQLLYLLLLSCSRADDLAPFLTPDWTDPVSPLVSEQPLMAVYIDYLGDLNYDRWPRTLKQLAPELDSTMDEMVIRMLRLIFLEHHKERVKMLSIPITHLQPYMSFIPHLKNLQGILFYEDDLDGTHDKDDDDQELVQTDSLPQQQDATEEAPSQQEGADIRGTMEAEAEESLGMEQEQEGHSQLQEQELPQLQAPEGHSHLQEQELLQLQAPEEHSQIQAPEEHSQIQGAPEEHSQIQAPEEHSQIQEQGEHSQPQEQEGHSQLLEQEEHSQQPQEQEGHSQIQEQGGDSQLQESSEGLSSDRNGDRDPVIDNITNPEVNVVEVTEATVEATVVIATEDNEHITMGIVVTTGEVAAEIMGETTEDNTINQATPDGNGNELETAGEENADQQNEGELEPPAQVGPVFNPTPRAVEFIQAHRALFNPSRIPESFYRQSSSYRPSSLKDPLPPGHGLVAIVPPQRWIHPGWTQNPTYDTWYIQLLQAQESPGLIAFENWKQFPTFLDRTTLDGVKRLRTPCGETSEEHWDQGKLLQRCRRLERFSAALRSPHDFRWAVEEQKDRDMYEDLVRKGIAGAASSLSEGQSHGGYFVAGPDPVQLRKVVIRNGEERYSIPVIKDICFAFKKTLESILFRIQSVVDDDMPLSIFHTMPRLTVLEIHVNQDSAVINDHNFLKNCPALQILRIVGGDHKETDVNAGVQDPWHLPELQELTLVGPVCDVFNYGTFVHTPKIQTIRLERTLKNIGVRQVSEDYLAHLSRPSCSWNWSLPRLRSMTLRGYSAHLFRPSLLLGCPNLRRLELDLESVSRTVTKSQDFMFGYHGFDSPVRDLVLNGRWIMTESTDLFRDFLQTWFNGIQYLHMDATQFSSKESMVDGLLSLKSLRKSVLRRHRLSYYEAWKMGFEEIGFRCSREWDIKRRVQVSIIDGKELRRLARERLLEQEAQELKHAERLLMFQDMLDIMETSFAVLRDMDDSIEAEQDNEEERSIENPSTQQEEGVGSGENPCENEQKQADDEAEILRKAEEEAQEEREEAEEDLQDILRCVYVFRGKRYRYSTHSSHQ